VESRLRLAKELNASAVVKVGEDDMRQICRKFTGSKGFDIIIETSGAPASLSNAIAVAKNGGTIVLIGSLERVEPDLPIIDAVFKELNILGSYRYCNMYPVVVDVLESNLNLRRLITHHYPIEKSQEAFEFVRDHKEECMKVVIEI